MERVRAQLARTRGRVQETRTPEAPPATRLLGTHHLATSPHLLEHLLPSLPPIDNPLVGGGFWLRRAGGEA
ncbi:hypothetical protein GCM10023339_77720 [Alloalcanivorax gelatiniphagus]